MYKMTSYISKEIDALSYDLMSYSTVKTGQNVVINNIYITPVGNNHNINHANLKLLNFTVVNTGVITKLSVCM